jgi:hypothetical protein
MMSLACELLPPSRLQPEIGEITQLPRVISRVVAEIVPEGPSASAPTPESNSGSGTQDTASAISGLGTSDQTIKPSPQQTSPAPAMIASGSTGPGASHSSSIEVRLGGIRRAIIQEDSRGREREKHITYLADGTWRLQRKG